MSIEGLRNQTHREAARVMQRLTRRVPCIVDAYNPSQHTVKVKRQPEDTLTGWHPIETHQIGLLIAPNIGDPGWLEFHDGDPRAPIFVGAAHNDRNPPPKQIEAGELYYQNKAGQWIYIKADGSITTADGAGASLVAKGGVLTATDKANSTVVLDGAGNIAAQSNGTINATAPNIALTAAQAIALIAQAITGGNGGSLHKLVTDALVTLFNSHTHIDSRGGATSVPQQLMTNSQLTATMTAN